MILYRKTSDWKFHFFKILLTKIEIYETLGLHQSPRPLLTNRLQLTECSLQYCRILCKWNIWYKFYTSIHFCHWHNAEIQMFQCLHLEVNKQNEMSVQVDSGLPIALNWTYVFDRWSTIVPKQHESHTSMIIRWWWHKICHRMQRHP